ncbi:MAG: YggS family pyridoxal phosphate-dependent enzyme [Chloroflexi bacterium]|nr:YggS family pyridoxal phosphate-dependent enzyme [Chloroflexota bacterium]
MEIVGGGPPTAEQIRQRHARILGRLRDVAAASSHDPDRLRIVAVTKGWPVDVARSAVDAGLRTLGESRVQEAEPKVEALPDVEWHFIGRLQSNKARRAVRAFRMIHSVDGRDLLRRLDEIGAEEEFAPRLLLQVNVSGEAVKAGIDPDLLGGGIRDWPGVERVVGLMTIAPMAAAAEEARRIFGRLRRLRDALEQEVGRSLPELSMGMTADAEAAASEGATLVRIGTALFGPRP